MEKQVILAKSEYDEMESELEDLKNIVESKTVSRILVPTPNIYYTHAVYNQTAVSYVIGADENEVVKELAQELEKERKEHQELMSTRFEQGMIIMELRKEVSSWKKLPWYKRLFIRNI